jgi:Asp-tRNA(Asn)/Glu-tRNA(Gln) amidotransferase A subunit family amidase
MCRDSEDARLLGEALLGRPLERGNAKGIRLGVPRAQLWNDLDPQVASLCERALEALREAGAQTKEVSLDGVEHSLIATVLLLGIEGVPSTDPGVAAEIAPHLSPLIRGLRMYQLLMPAITLVKAERLRVQLRRSVARLLRDVDALVWPSVPAPAPPVEDATVTLPSGDYPADFANVRLGGIANLAGTPAVSTPCGLTEDGLPVGLQLLCAWNGDARLLDVAELFEAATGRRFVEVTPPLAQRAAA